MPEGADPVENAERRRPHFQHENRLRAAGIARLIAGIDEAGRGPLAGPVVAAAVILPEDFFHGHLRDSKKLSPKRRAAIYRELTTDPAVTWACAVVDSREIDRLNILRATHAAMRRAALALACRPDHVLIDGLPVVPFPLPHTAIVDGDNQSLSIAAASVIAKVTRDRIMEEMDGRYPLYGFARHKGYPTSRHLAILASHGPCPIHRYTFRPVGQPMFPLLATIGGAAAAAALAAARALAKSRPIPAMSSDGAGKKIACRFLRSRGYKVLYRNYRAPRGGEVDVACRHGETLVFVEVKTRADSVHGRPADAVNALKQRQIMRGARAWLRLLDNPDIPFRFDIVEVIAAPGEKPVCHVIENAFTLPPHAIY